MRSAAPRIAGLVALVIVASAASAASERASGDPCADCLRVRVGPPTVVRGPFPDELDAPFAALRLSDGSYRGFSANGTSYAVDGSVPGDMGGPRRVVLEPGEAGTASECGRWLTSVVRSGDKVVGLVHQERACDYNQGQSDKSMAIATSLDDGLSWTLNGNIVGGRDSPQRGRITGEGDCTMVDGRDGYLYAYCLRNSDWQTIVARAPTNDLTDWRKYHEGEWTEPGLGGRATAIGFLGPSSAYLSQPGWVATLTADQWFGGLRLSLSSDKVSFFDVEEPLVQFDEGGGWDLPTDSDFVAYASLLDPSDGSNSVGQHFLLAYIFVPSGKGFESRYLVQHDVSLSVEDEPPAVQVGLALTRWVDAARQIYVTSTGPLTGDRRTYRQDAIVAYMLTRAPEGIASIKFEECSSDWPGHLDHALADDGSCEAGGYVRERTAGWLYARKQPGTVPVYRCHEVEARTHFASNSPDCEGLGTVEFLLGYGLAP